MSCSAVFVPFRDVKLPSLFEPRPILGVANVEDWLPWDEDHVLSHGGNPFGVVDVAVIGELGGVNVDDIIRQEVFGLELEYLGDPDPPVNLEVFDQFTECGHVVWILNPFQGYQVHGGNVAMWEVRCKSGVATGDSGRVGCWFALGRHSGL